MLALLNAREAPPRRAITPAISTLSRRRHQGGRAFLARAVLPITIVILVGLILVQSRSTGFIARIFGPVMLGRFLALALNSRS